MPLNYTARQYWEDKMKTMLLILAIGAFATVGFTVLHSNVHSSTFDPTPSEDVNQSGHTGF
jgi:hypothetical protein